MFINYFLIYLGVIIVLYLYFCFKNANHDFDFWSFFCWYSRGDYCKEYNLSFLIISLIFDWIVGISFWHYPLLDRLMLYTVFLEFITFIVVTFILPLVIILISWIFIRYILPLAGIALVIYAVVFLGRTIMKAIAFLYHLNV